MVVLGRGLGSDNYYVSELVQRSLTNTYFIPDPPLGMTEGEKSLMDVDQYFEIYDWLNQVEIPILLTNQNEANQEITNSTLLNFVAGQNKVKSFSTLKL